jgi:hypothetical protein
MVRRLGRFLLFVLKPARGAWNVIAAAGGTIGSLWLWAAHHPLIAGFLALSTVVLLLVIAGYRFQREREERDQWSQRLDRLGELLVEGENVKTGFVIMESFSKDPQMADLVDETMTGRYGRWLNDCTAFLPQLGPDYVGRYLSQSGQTSSVPWPHSLVLGEHHQLYEQAEHQCQRLHEFVREIRSLLR